MSDNLSLPFGASWLLLPGTMAAWGARLIFPDDLVYDRQGSAVLNDNSAEHKELSTKTVDWLNEKIELIYEDKVYVKSRRDYKTVTKTENLTRMGHARRKARKLADNYEMKSSSTFGYVLFLDGKGAIVATPNASHGYLYVAAYLYDALSNGCTPQSDGTELARKYGREETN